MLLTLIIAYGLALGACADTDSAPPGVTVERGQPDAGADADTGGQFRASLPQASPAHFDDSLATRVDLTSGDAWSPPEHIDSCHELLNCHSRCSADIECIEACDEAATDEAKSREQALVSCINSSGCSNEHCIMEKCGRQMDACFGG